MNRIKFSFVIPVIDQIKYTRDCLLSWFAYADGYLHESEILIVDDGSSEQTKAFLSKLPSPVRVITNVENMGFARSNNLAVSEARGEYVILLNNDVVLQAGWLEAMWTSLVSTNLDRVVGNVQISRYNAKVDHVGKFFDENGDPRHFGQFYQNLFPWKPPVDFMKFPSVTAACWILKKSVYESLNGFDEVYKNGFEDDDFCMRAQEAGVEVGVALRSWIYHYVSSSTGRKTFESENHTLFMNRWKEQSLKWHEDHFDDFLRTLKSWSLNY